MIDFESFCLQVIRKKYCSVDYALRLYNGEWMTDDREAINGIRCALAVELKINDGEPIDAVYRFGRFSKDNEPISFNGYAQFRLKGVYED